MRITALLAGILLLGGCGPFRRVQAPPPPPGPVPVRIPDQVTSLDPAPPPQNLPPPPPIAGGGADAKAGATQAVGLQTAPAVGPPRPARARKAAKKAKPVPPADPSGAEAEAPMETPPYRLGELRSPEEREKLRLQADRMLGVCQAALAAAEGRNLTAMQSEMVNRVRGFAQQARDVMEKDPGEARNFAAKARTFAEALLAELKR